MIQHGNEVYGSWFVDERGQFGSIIQVQSIEGELFERKEQADQHELELCKTVLARLPPKLLTIIPSRILYDPPP
jgi:hypothetical protein